MYHYLPICLQAPLKRFAWMIDTLSVDGIAGLEVNVSCSKCRVCEGMAFGVDPKVVEQ